MKRSKGLKSSSPQQIPKAYNNPLLKDLYLMLRERQKFANLDIPENGTPEGRVLSIEWELRNLTSASNFQIFYMGGLLVEAKKILPHGQFGAWVKEKIPFSPRTANSYMQVFNVCLGMPELLFSVKRSVLEEICGKGFPEGLKKKLPEILEKCGELTTKDLAKLKDEYSQGKLDMDSKHWQLFITERQQLVYESVNLKVIDGLIIFLKRELKKLEALAVPNGVNKLLSPKQQAKDLIPLVRDAVKDFIGVLEELHIDYEIELAKVRNEYLINDIKNIRIDIQSEKNLASLKQQRNNCQEIDDGTFSAAYYEKIMSEELGPDDFIRRDEAEPDDWYCKKVLEHLGPDDFIYKDEFEPTSWHYNKIIEQLGPDDIVNVDDGISAEEHAVMMVD